MAPGVTYVLFNVQSVDMDGRRIVFDILGMGGRILCWGAKAKHFFLSTQLRFLHAVQTYLFLMLAGHWNLGQFLLASGFM